MSSEFVKESSYLNYIDLNDMRPEGKNKPPFPIIYSDFFRDSFHFLIYYFHCLVAIFTQLPDGLRHVQLVPPVKYSLLPQLLHPSNFSTELLLHSWRTNAMQRLLAWHGLWLRIVALLLQWSLGQQQAIFPLPTRPRHLRHLWNR